jgi:nicotinamide mononucleotide adenylyltransferase
MKSIAYCFGRYSPVTRGHIEHIQAVIDYAKEFKMEYGVYTSNTMDIKKNPLPPHIKIDYIQKAIPGVTVGRAVNMFTLLDELISKHYTNIVYFAGSDYFDDPVQKTMFDRLTAHALKSGVTLTSISSGNRTEGISGTALRNAVLQNDFTTFYKASPLGIGGITLVDVQRMFAECGIGLKPFHGLKS